MSVLNDEIVDLVSNKYLFQGLQRNVKNWENECILQIYYRLLSVYDSNFNDGFCPTSKKGRCVMARYIQRMGMGHLIHKLDDLTQYTNVLKIISHLDDKISAKYNREAASQRVRSVVKLEQLSKKEKRIVSQENINPVGCQIASKPASEPSNSENLKKQLLVAEGRQIPRTPLKPPPVDVSIAKKSQPLGELQGNGQTTIRRHSLKLEKPNSAVSSHERISNYIPCGRQIPRTPKFLDSTVSRTDTVFDESNELLNCSNHQEFKFSRLNQNCVEDGNSVSSNTNNKSQGHAVMVNDTYIEVLDNEKRISHVEEANDSFEMYQLGSKGKDLNNTTQSLESKVSLTKECITGSVQKPIDNSVPLLAESDREILSARKSADDATKFSMEGVCEIRTNHTFEKIIKSNTTVEKELKHQSEESKAIHIPESSIKSELPDRDDKRRCEQDFTESDLKDANDRESGSSMTIASTQKSEEESFGGVMTQKDFVLLDEVPLSITGTPDIVNDSVSLREYQKNMIPKGKQLKRTPTNVSPPEEVGKGCVVLDYSVLNDSKIGCEVTKLDSNADYSLQIFVKSKKPRSSEMKYNETETEVNDENASISTCVKNLDSRKVIIPKQIFNKEPESTSNVALQELDDGVESVRMSKEKHNPLNSSRKDSKGVDSDDFEGDIDALSSAEDRNCLVRTPSELSKHQSELVCSGEDKDLSRENKDHYASVDDNSSTYYLEIENDLMKRQQNISLGEVSEKLCNQMQAADEKYHDDLQKSRSEFEDVISKQNQKSTTVSSDEVMNNKDLTDFPNDCESSDFQVHKNLECVFEDSFQIFPSRKEKGKLKRVKENDGKLDGELEGKESQRTEFGNLEVIKDSEGKDNKEKIAHLTEDKGHSYKENKDEMKVDIGKANKQKALCSDNQPLVRSRRTRQTKKKIEVDVELYSESSDSQSHVRSKRTRQAKKKNEVNKECDNAGNIKNSGNQKERSVPELADKVELKKPQVTKRQSKTVRDSSMDSHLHEKLDSVFEDSFQIFPSKKGKGRLERIEENGRKLVESELVGKESQKEDFGNPEVINDSEFKENMEGKISDLTGDRACNNKENKDEKKVDSIGKEKKPKRLSSSDSQSHVRSKRQTKKKTEVDMEFCSESSDSLPRGRSKRSRQTEKKIEPNKELCSESSDSLPHGKIKRTRQTEKKIEVDVELCSKSSDSLPHVRSKRTRQTKKTIEENAVCDNADKIETSSNQKESSLPKATDKVEVKKPKVTKRQSKRTRDSSMSTESIAGKMSKSCHNADEEIASASGGGENNVPLSKENTANSMTTKTQSTCLEENSVYSAKPPRCKRNNSNSGTNIDEDKYLKKNIAKSRGSSKAHVARIDRSRSKGESLSDDLQKQDSQTTDCSVASPTTRPTSRKLPSRSSKTNKSIPETSHSKILDNVVNQNISTYSENRIAPARVPKCSKASKQSKKPLVDITDSIEMEAREPRRSARTRGERTCKNDKENDVYMGKSKKKEGYLAKNSLKNEKKGS